MALASNGAVKASTFKMKGKFYGMGAGIDYTGEFAIQPPDKLRIQMNIDVNGMKLAFIQVVDGKAGYKKVADMAATELSKDEIAEAAENAYAGRVQTLAPFIKDKDFELSPLGEVKVEDKEAVGVRVSHKGHRDINLFFDKKTGLLVKSERTVKDEMLGGKEVIQEELHLDYKEVDGVKHPMRIAIKRDGKEFVDGEDGLRALLNRFQAESERIATDAASSIGEAASNLHKRLSDWQQRQNELEQRLEAKREELKEKGLEIQAGAILNISKRLNQIKTQLVAERKRSQEHTEALAARARAGASLARNGFCRGGRRRTCERIHRPANRRLARSSSS